MSGALRARGQVGSAKARKSADRKWSTLRVAGPGRRRALSIEVWSQTTRGAILRCATGHEAGKNRARRVPFAVPALVPLAIAVIAALRRRRMPRALHGPPVAEAAGAPDPAADGISAFFPAFNDEATIERLAGEMSAVLAELVDDYEVWIIDDGSTDRTGEIADRLAASDPRVNVVHHGANRGYGGALKSGLEHAGKGLVFYTDGDGQYDIGEFRLLFSRRHDADVVNGYKVNRDDSVLRRVAGSFYNTVARFLFDIKISDVDCDFRLMRSGAVRDLGLESEGGAICVEMIRRIQDRGCSFVEVPVRHYAREHGKSQFFNPRNLFKMLKDLSKQFWGLVVKPAITGKMPP